MASTEDIDGHGTIVRQNWRLDRFKPKGVVLYAHDYDELPIGTGVVSVEGGKLQAFVTFSTKELNPKAEEVWLNVDADVIRGISPGFIPHTMTFERHDDREVLVLDDNELIELSITPCPSNAAALAQVRSMARPPTARAADVVTVAVTVATPQTPPPAIDGPAANAPQPIQEERHMAEVKTPDPINTVTVARALGLPVGATEQDAINRSLSLSTLEVQALAITGAKTSDEAVGAIRAMKDASTKLTAALERLSVVEAERDVQNFETLVQRGRADLKLDAAKEKYWRDLFEKSCKDGAGSAKVEELRGYLSVASPDLRRSHDVKQPATGSNNSGVSTPLLWNGKAYAELKPAQRAKLASDEPELFRIMKDHHEATAA